MNYIDIIIIAIFIWSASLFALFLGIYGAIHFSDFTAGWLTDRLDLKSQHTNLIAFAVTFILIIIAVHLIARLLDKLVEAVALGFFNRIAGVLFNLLKTAFIISVILVILNRINDNFKFLPEKQVEQSVLYKPLSALAPAIFPRLKFEYERIKEEHPFGGEMLTENGFLYH